MLESDIEEVKNGWAFTFRAGERALFQRVLFLCPSRMRRPCFALLCAFQRKSSEFGLDLQSCFLVVSVPERQGPELLLYWFKHLRHERRLQAGRELK